MSSQSYGKIYKVVKQKQPMNMSAVRAFTRREVTSQHNKSAVKLKCGITPGRSLLLAELEEMYKSRCKSNASTKRTMKYDYDNPNNLNNPIPAVSSEFTPLKTIWGRWSKKKNNIDTKPNQ